jgi:hypothetical protein
LIVTTKKKFYNTRHLVNELVKGMLAVGAGFAPDDRPGGVVNLGT